MSKLIKLICFLFFITATYGQTEIYELRVYELQFPRPSAVMHDYFKDALIPALNRSGVEQIGVFEDIGESMPQKIYMLISYPNMQAIQEVADKLAQDKQFASDAKAYHNTTPDIFPVRQVESSFIRSTEGFPNLANISETNELFELRIYESYNEDALRRKVKMFTDSEFQIFEDIGLPIVFFGPNISGSQMPCLTYLLAFKDMEARDEAWSKFGPHPEWQRILKLEEYANTVSNIYRVFLKRLDYSQM